MGRVGQVGGEAQVSQQAVHMPRGQGWEMLAGWLARHRAMRCSPCMRGHRVFHHGGRGRRGATERQVADSRQVAGRAGSGR